MFNVIFIIIKDAIIKGLYSLNHFVMLRWGKFYNYK